MTSLVSTPNPLSSPTSAVNQTAALRHPSIIFSKALSSFISKLPRMEMFGGVHESWACYPDQTF